MGLLWKKLFRELLHHKIRSIVIILLIAMSIAFYSGMVLLKDNVLASLDKTYEELHYEDVAFRVLGYAPQDNFTDLADSIPNIKYWDTRLALKSLVQVDDVEFNGKMFGIDPTRQPNVNNLLIVKGSYFSPTDNTSVLLQEIFAEKNNLKVGDKLIVLFGSYKLALTIKALVFSPEFKYSVDDNGAPSPGTFAPFWVPLPLVQQLFGKGQVVNEYLIQVHEKSKINQTIDDVTRILLNRGISVASTQGDKEPDHKMMMADIGAVDEYAVSFGLVVLFTAIFVIYDGITKIIASQRTTIGILRAMGSTKQKLLVHYMSIGLILSILGIILSFPITYEFSVLFRDFYLNFLKLRITALSFNWVPLYKFSAVVILTALLASLFAAYRVASILPVEAMSGYFKEQGFSHTIIDKVVDKLSRKRKVTIKIPIRHIFGRKRRTLLTTLTVTLATVLVLSSLGSMDSILYQINQYFDNNLQYQLLGYLDGPHDPNEIFPQLENYSSVNRVEGIVRQFALIKSPSYNATTVLNAFPQDSALRKYTFREGSLKKGEIVIGSKLAKDLNVGVGDTVSVITQSYGFFPFTIKNFTISGIVAELLDVEIFLDLATAQAFLSLGNRITGVAIQVKSDDQVTHLKKDLLDSNIPFITIEDALQVKNSVLALMQGLIGFISVVVIIGIVILLLFSLNVVVLDVMEREREFINLRTNGASTYKISSIISLQLFFILIFTFILEFPFTYYITDWLNHSVTEDIMVITTYISPTSYLLGFFSLIIGTGLGLIFAIRYALKIDLALMTRLRFRS